jgi:chemotaxis protein MotB
VASSIETHTNNSANNDAKDSADKPMKSKENIANSQELADLRLKLLESIKNHPDLKKYQNNLDFKVMADGLKIDLRSLEGQPMFTIGKADFESYAKNIIKWLSQELANNSKKISIIGHTDSQPYIKNDPYTNWELSVDRANNVRRYLIEYGMNKDKIIRVQGASDKNLYDKKDAFSPKNRRIEIIVLSDGATERLLEQ